MDFTLIDYQHRVLESSAPYTGIIGGTGTGKTYFAPLWLYTRMVQHPGYEWIVSSPTYNMLMRNPWKYINRQWKERKIKFHPNKSGDGGPTIETPHGTVYFISAETPDRMQGIHAKGIIGDEAGLYPRLWYETAIQRLSLNSGQMMLITTPYGLNWLKTDCFDPFLSGDKDFYFETPASYQNPKYPLEEIARAKRKLPDWKFRMMYLGQFVKPAGLIYPEYQTVDPFPIPEDWTIGRGLDFGFNHPTAIPLIAEAPDGTFYVIDDFKRSGLTLDSLYGILSERTVHDTYADYAQKQDLETLRARGLDIRYADKAVLPGILYLSELLRTGRLKVFSTCKHLIDELNTYAWATDRNEQMTDAPNKKAGNDDLLDALRYYLYTKHCTPEYNTHDTIDTEPRERGNDIDPWRM